MEAVLVMMMIRNLLAKERNLKVRKIQKQRVRRRKRNLIVKRIQRQRVRQRRKRRVNRKIVPVKIQTKTRSPNQRLQRKEVEDQIVRRRLMRLTMKSTMNRLRVHHPHQMQDLVKDLVVAVMMMMTMIRLNMVPRLTSCVFFFIIISTNWVSIIWVFKSNMNALRNLFNTNFSNCKKKKSISNKIIVKIMLFYKRRKKKSRYR
uniref:Uncharacterized protein n=1 Tax=Cacopsylla melanoneura TaxID=428564 RepID=A0A8D8UXU2_9HEMI